MSVDAVVLDYYDCLLRSSDLMLLNESLWINDNLIGFAFEYFEREQFHPLCSEVAFVGPHVTQCIKFMSADEACLVLEPAKILDRNLVFFAINDNASADSIGGSHWSLLVYCKADQTCHHYDSMNQGNIQAAKRVWNFLRISTKARLQFIQADTPQQQNSCDCGLYVICITEFLCQQKLSSVMSNSSVAATTLQSSITPQTVSTKRRQLKELILSLSLAS